MSRIILEADFLRQIDALQRRIDQLERNARPQFVFDTTPPGVYGDEIVYGADPMRGTYWHLKYDARPPLYSTILDTPGLQRLYRFNETAGTVAVDSFGAKHGTYSNVTLNAGALWGPTDGTETETSISLNGTTSFVNIPTYDFLANPSFSIEFLALQANIAAGAQTVLWAGGTTPDTAVIVLERDGGTNSGMWDADFHTDSFSGAAANIKMWHRPALQGHNFAHVVFTYDAPTRTGTLYVDGQMEAQRVGTMGPYAGVSNPTIDIGRQAGAAASLYAGQLGFLAMYSRALTVNEVREHSSMMRSQFPWCWLGGSYLSEWIGTDESANSVYPTFGDPATYKGPQIPVLKNGIYNIFFGAENYNAAGTPPSTQVFALHGGNDSDGWANLGYESHNGQTAVGLAMGGSSLVANNIILSAFGVSGRRNFVRMRYAQTANNPQYRKRWIQGYPTRLAVG